MSDWAEGTMPAEGMDPRKRQMLAQMLASMGNQPTRMQGRVAMPQSPLDSLSKAMMRYMAMGGKLPGG